MTGQPFLVRHAELPDETVSLFGGTHRVDLGGFGRVLADLPPTPVCTALTSRLHISGGTSVDGTKKRGGASLQVPLLGHGPVKPHNALEVQYLQHLAAEGISHHTARKRVYLMRALGDPITAGTQEVISVLTSPKLSAHTREAYHLALRTIFADLIRMELRDTDPMVRLKKPKTARREPRPIPKRDLDRILAIPSRREREWSVLGAYLGLRAGEVLSMSGDALCHTDQGPAVRIKGKGDTDLYVAAHQLVVDVLSQYEGPGLIWSMWPSSLDRAWARACAEVGVTGYVFHQLRHSFCTRLLQASGGDLLLVSKLARHASVATTQKYTALTDAAPFHLIGNL